MLVLAFRYSYPNVNFDPEMEFNAGYPSQYENGVDERWKNGFGVWIVKEEGRLCTFKHLYSSWLYSKLAKQRS